MSKNIRLEVKADFKNKKSILDALNKSVAIQISSTPNKGGGFTISFSVKSIMDKKSVDEVLDKIPIKSKEPSWIK